MIKGVVQVNTNIATDEYRIFTYIDSPDRKNLQVVYPHGLSDTMWKKDQIAGEGNENFRPFHLWFEYETSGDS